MERKKVLLTGGTAGIGRAISLLLAQNGYTIFLIGRSEEKLEDLKKDIEERNLSEYFHFSLTDLTDLQAFEQQIRDWDAWHGPFDVLINNAAIGFEGVCGKTIKEIEYLVSTNVLSYMWLAGFIGDRMIENKVEGEIMNIGSMSATTKDANSSGYVATKSGIRGFSEALRKEFNPENIRVTLIEPGLVGSDMQATTPAEEREKQKAMEMLEAEDIANIVLHVLQQPKRVDFCEIKIKPLKQII